MDWPVPCGDSCQPLCLPTGSAWSVPQATPRFPRQPSEAAPWRQACLLGTYLCWRFYRCWRIWSRRYSPAPPCGFYPPGVLGILSKVAILSCVWQYMGAWIQPGKCARSACRIQAQALALKIILFSKKSDILFWFLSASVLLQWPHLGKWQYIQGWKPTLGSFEVRTLQNRMGDDVRLSILF